MLYEGLYRDDAMACDNVVLADGIMDLGGSSLRVDFTIYSGNSSFSAVSDKTWYGLIAKDPVAAMTTAGASSVQTQTGSAFAEVIRDGDSRLFHLMKSTVDDAAKRSY